MDDAHWPVGLERSLLLEPHFSPLQFLLSRKHTPLESLRQDLSGATKSLRIELIDLINADYADFIALSTTLVDVDELLDGLQRPLESAKAVVKVVFPWCVTLSLLINHIQQTVQDSLMQTSQSLKVTLEERAFILRERVCTWTRVLLLLMIKLLNICTLKDSLGLAHQIAESIGKTEGLLDGLSLRGGREECVSICNLEPPLLTRQIHTYVDWIHSRPLNGLP
jgi:hypothetical protein